MLGVGQSKVVLDGRLGVRLNSAGPQLRIPETEHQNVLESEETKLNVHESLADCGAHCTDTEQRFYRNVGCLGQGFYSCPKHHDQEASCRRKGLFSLYFHIAVHH